MAGKVGNKTSLNFWKSDWFVGLTVSAVVLALGNAHLLQTLERKLYDAGLGMMAREASDRIAVIAIDQPSLDRMGAWPWSREAFARVIERLAEAQAQVIATTVPFAQPRHDPGLDYIRRIGALHADQRAASAAAAAERNAALQAQEARRQGEIKVGAGRTAIFVPPPVMATAPAPETAPVADAIAALLTEAEEKLDGDRQLAIALGQAGNVVLPVHFRLAAAGAGDAAAPAYLRASAVKLAATAKRSPPPAPEVAAGVAEIFAAHTAALGHANLPRDADGILRGTPLALWHANLAFPALALQVAARSLDLEPEDILIRPGETVRLGKHKIATDEQTRLLNFFYRDGGGGPAFPVTSFFDILNGKAPIEQFRGKIVLIGPTVVGFDDMFATPAAGTLPAVLVLAHAVSNILSGHHFAVPAWSGWIEWGAFTLIALYLMFLLPRLSRLAGMGSGGMLLLLLLGTQMGLLTGQMMWVPLLLPLALLFFGHLGLAAKRCLLAGRDVPPPLVPESLPPPAEVPIALPPAPHGDTIVMERSPCAALPPLSGEAPPREEAPEFSADGMEMLGHYRIEHEIGKGAMGRVYRGRDTRDNRPVALKTLALAQEFDAAALADVRARFFREAETIARLEHANIVKVFGGGEERHLAYIAMELLAGRDLMAYTRPETRLPLPTVVGIVARVAAALDYAHGNHVVHRDIKPDNIMYEPASDLVKVMDFGIARITDTAQTRTGMVLGSPAYMSPEQLAGKKIDGRSDLFSLGITLYQLCTGQLPFAGETMAKLMFTITGTPHPDPRRIVPEMPACLAAVIDKALVKDPELRYQTGAAVAQDLWACLPEIKKVA